MRAEEWLFGGLCKGELLQRLADALKGREQFEDVNCLSHKLKPGQQSP